MFINKISHFEFPNGVNFLIFMLRIPRTTWSFISMPFTITIIASSTPSMMIAFLWNCDHMRINNSLINLLIINILLMSLHSAGQAVVIELCRHHLLRRNILNMSIIFIGNIRVRMKIVVWDCHCARLILSICLYWGKYEWLSLFIISNCLVKSRV